MYFKNKKHADRFYKAISEGCFSTENKEVMAAVYLLTVKKKVWEHFEGHVDGEDGISISIFEGIEVRNETEEALITAAYDLLFCMDCINLTDLTEKETIPDEAFMAIWYAVTYVRFGFDDGTHEAHIVEYV